MTNSNREMVTTNKVDKYLVDEKKSRQITLWMTEVISGADKVESFITSFPTDSVVENYLLKGTSESKRDLMFHIEVLESGLPLRLYFDAHGLTNNNIVKTLGKWINSNDGEISLRALNIALKYKFPPEKSIRITPRQVNTFNFTGPERKEAMERILRKVNEDTE